MKKYLFIVLAAVISLFSSCAEDDAAIGLSGLKVSQSYVALPVEGGSTDITIESKSEWIITGNDKADWLTISTTQGPQGESKITFSADEAVDGRSVELKITQARLNSHSRAPSLKLLLLNSLPPRLVLHNTALVV